MANPMVGARVDPDTHGKIIAVCNSTGMSQADLVKEAISRYLGRAGGGNRAMNRIDRLEDRVAQLEQLLEQSRQAVSMLKCLNV